MGMRHLGLVCVVVFGTILISRDGRADGDDTHRDPSFWMKKKMAYSQAIFEGIANEDFDQIIDNAESMRALSRIEAFVKRRNAAYNTQLQIFQATVRDIVTQANKENLEGTTLAFTQLTISCVKCHQAVRHDGGKERAIDSLRSREADQSDESSS